MPEPTSSGIFISVSNDVRRVGREARSWAWITLQTGPGQSGLVLRDQNDKMRDSFELVGLFGDFGAVLMIQDSPALITVLWR